MELGGCFPRRLSQTIPMSVMVPPPSQTGLKPKSPLSRAAFSGRSQGPALALGRLQGLSSGEGLVLTSSQWVALGQTLFPNSSGKPSQRDHSGPSQLCLIYPSFCLQGCWHKAVESPSLMASELPQFSQVLWGPEAVWGYFLSCPG